MIVWSVYGKLWSCEVFGISSNSWVWIEPQRPVRDGWELDGWQWHLRGAAESEATSILVFITVSECIDRTDFIDCYPNTWFLCPQVKTFPLHTEHKSAWDSGHLAIQVDVTGPFMHTGPAQTGINKEVDLHAYRFYVSVSKGFRFKPPQQLQHNHFQMNSRGLAFPNWSILGLRNW